MPIKRVDIEIINKIKAYLDDCHLEYPTIENNPDLSKFTPQDCEMDEFEFEMINQDSGGGILGDSFSGQMAFPLSDNNYIIVDYCT